MSAVKQSKPRPPLFRALGGAEPPEVIDLDGTTYERLEIYKHDSWAATALYRSGEKLAICKFNRVQPVFCFGMAWLGLRLANRERRFLERLADVPNVPKPFLHVRCGGRLLANACARVFIPGHPLKSGERVNDQFFSKLKSVLDEMHRRGMAYVDLHKRENIIVGDDGQPYLIDFQVSFDKTHKRIRWFPLSQTIYGLLAQADDYHWLKHVLKHRPDLIAVKDEELKRYRPWWIKGHRLIGQPLRELRRRLLVLLGVRTGKGRAVTETFAEDAVRRESEGPAVSEPTRIAA